ncbi:hypothetical protein NDU88_000880 [Pleurodeles waltl]|uniref:Uncharacterized protein n=1 Tax=Pleurodeles waltl TaxID=8319 RepID=A0AAV7NB15_PLEWA|nr:hypothetical protein NDU88_000880 [Pleurodeles waltl]
MLGSGLEHCSQGYSTLGPRATLALMLGSGLRHCSQGYATLGLESYPGADARVRRRALQPGLRYPVPGESGERPVIP